MQFLRLFLAAGFATLVASDCSVVQPGDRDPVATTPASGPQPSLYGNCDPNAPEPCCTAGLPSDRHIECKAMGDQYYCQIEGN
ncbi:hypothetical protein NUU61_004082 [Penicillium alfredii]|uniref:Uncharacterized protein n=1 Tax=Penicillium alfredii TaxID=1506179 RepID=A0A9W9FKI8_9EURO|nr:uncharacterized protein NUU61_004082 [Penicillium alfredii]KAJ5101860.1 hypothetical protein NUU61_004082 [Penicillium alfredii]